MMEEQDNFSPDVIYMRMALHEAMRAAEAGEVPVGAVIVKDGEVLGKAHNQTETLQDPTAHAEVLAITQAANAVGNWRLTDCTLYVTKEPCPMCAGAIILARIPRVIWGIDDPKRGGAASKFTILNDGDLNHRPKYESGLMEEECRYVIQDFFRRRRAEAKKRKLNDE
ncbi:tRNA adenosine(34) deaminase TadA [Verrucomicrobiota bacterium]